ncbi:MAG TPA: ketopantoate reductase family protein [bacterium]|nr:ketopantoate reductase family protein [bacterium]
MDMKILVFGAGAVGQAVGCLLAADGHKVDLILRERFIEKIKADGLTVSGIFGDYFTEKDKLGLYTKIEDISGKLFDYILITTKSYDTKSAALELMKLKVQAFTAVSMQNGCGNFETLVEHFGEERSLGARVITGFEIEQAGRVNITVTADDIHIGGQYEDTVPEYAVTIASAINKAGLPCVTTPHIKRDLLAKLLYNCALNPLGAVMGVHYGALGDDPSMRAIMNNIIREVFDVIEAMGAKTHWDNAEEYLKYFYEKQVLATYNHRPSMLQDIENGKRTEIDALTGYVSSQGRLYNVPTPVCDVLTEQVRFMEKNRGK